jgi:catechol 2,3-dioxygenase-like lactoylglutathione lyase family enzyme
MPRYSYDHIHIVSADPVKASDFYVRAFGAKKLSERSSPEVTSVGLDIGGTRLLIRTPRDNKTKEDAPRMRRGLEHFGLHTDDLNGAIADLKGKGVKIFTNITVAPSGRSFVFVEAPDNVHIELLEGELRT